MSKKCRFFAALGLVWLMPGAVAGQDFSAGYRDSGGLQSAVNDLARANRSLVEVLPVAVSSGGREIRAIRLGAGDDVDGRPALLVLGNVWGPHLVGSEIALNVAADPVSRYGQDSVVTDLLDRRTVYFIPRVNPDAAEAFFSGPLMEQARNDGSGDDDHDWTDDEDGPEDLNGDGLITMMRVADPTGDWIADEANPSLMRKAEREKGETGAYRLLVEGTDNDGDEEWNEDPAGGTDINANFSYKYDYFGAGTGLFQMSSAEAKGVADFVIQHGNIAAVYVLGPQDNLLEPWKHKNARGIAGNAEGTSAGGPFSSILQADQPYFERVSESFQEITGLDEGPSSADVGGDALSWAYYHMGRWAFGSRGWWIPETPEPEDSTEAGDEETESSETAEPHASLKGDYNAYRWIQANVPGGFVEWTAVDHPDFPDRTVEVGGFAPYVRINPPATLLDSLTRPQSDFIADLAGSLPSISLHDVTVQEIGRRTFRIEARVVNSGYLPTLAAIGVRAFWPRRIRLELQLDGQEMVGGRAVTLIGPIGGNGGARDFSWVVVGNPGSSVTISASSPVAGTSAETVTLR